MLIFINVFETSLKVTLTTSCNAVLQPLEMVLLPWSNSPADGPLSLNIKVWDEDRAVDDEAHLQCLASCCHSECDWLAGALLCSTLWDASGEQVYKHFVFLLTDFSIPRNKLVAHDVLLQVYSNHLYHITTKTANSHPVSVSHCPCSTVLQKISCMDHLVVIHDATQWTGTSFVCNTSETFILFLLSVLLSVYKKLMLAHCMLAAWNLACTLLSYCNCNTH